MKPKVFLTRRMPSAVMERLERETDLAWHAEDRAATKAEIIAGLKGRDALFCNILSWGEQSRTSCVVSKAGQLLPLPPVFEEAERSDGRRKDWRQRPGRRVFSPL